MQEREIEFKNLLTKTEYTALLAHFKTAAATTITQTNSYFDTPDYQLKEQHCGLRIRTFATKQNELTLKSPLPVGLLETTAFLSDEQTNDILAGSPLPQGEVYDALIARGIDPQAIVCFGSLTTERIECSYQSGLLVLDHSRYLGQEDYEIEFEVPDEQIGQLEFNALLEAFSIKQQPTSNKVARFYQALKEVN
ncbi:CYTH domain-containing protein [Brochothrix campestris]|uniref:CYTH domain-containing protein n=1 Tax=Brochothrix campestris TaxID=2757 RepID=UPI0038CF2CDD